MNLSTRCVPTAAFLLLLISCASLQHAKAEVKDGVRIERDISYVPDGDSSQRLDLYVPVKDEKGSDKPLPLLVWVHGGGWLGGSKSENPGAEGYAAIDGTRSLARDCKIGHLAHRLDEARHHGWSDAAHGVFRPSTPTPLVVACRLVASAHLTK